MSHYHGLDADLELLNLEFAESSFGVFPAPILDDTRFWYIPGNSMMNNAYGNYELNQAIQLSEYLLPSHSLVEDISPLPACLYEPTLETNLEIPGPVSTESDEKSARFTQGGEKHLKMSSIHPDLLHKVFTAVPITSGSQTTDTQEPAKRRPGRPIGSKTMQRVSFLASRRHTPENPVETHFS